MLCVITLNPFIINILPNLCYTFVVFKSQLNWKLNRIETIIIIRLLITYQIYWTDSRHIRVEQASRRALPFWARAFWIRARISKSESWLLLCSFFVLCLMTTTRKREIYDDLEYIWDLFHVYIFIYIYGLIRYRSIFFFVL